MSAPSSLCSFMAPTGLQDMNAAVTVVLDVKQLLLTEEEQAQQDADNFRQAFEDANHKCEELAGKQHEAQAAQEKRKADQHEVDVKVRGHMLVDAAVAEVWRQATCQVEKTRKAMEKLHLGWEALQSPWKIRLQLGVSPSCFFSRLRLVTGYGGSTECGSRFIKAKGTWHVYGIVGGN